MNSTVEDISTNLAEVKLQEYKVASVEVQFAYHVTNVKVEYDDEGLPNNKPYLKKLLWNKADDNYFDGDLLFRAPCVFFSTSLWKKELPTTTIYPRIGKLGEKFWRVKVPLTHFNAYKILYNSKIGKQVSLFLANPKEYEMIPQKIKEKANIAKEYLRIGENGLYYSNDSDVTNYFVNFVVFHDFTLSEDVIWEEIDHAITVPCYPAQLSPTRVDREDHREKLFKEFIERCKS